MSYIVMSGIDVKDKRIEAGTKVNKQDLGKSFKWLLEQGIVLDEKDVERARDEKGNLKGIRTVEVENFEEIKGTEKDWEADLILLAMGFLGPEHYAIDNLNVDLDERSNYKAEHNIHQTSNPKVFAAGDCRRGQSLVVWAINEGRAAAREIDQHLMGSTTLK